MGIRKVSDDNSQTPTYAIGTGEKSRIDCLFWKVDRKVQKYTTKDGTRVPGISYGQIAYVSFSADPG